jgi:glycosyltransferase involved in cell wall biosynthesis
VFNEQKNPLFSQLLSSLKRVDLEVVFVDGGSRDGTCERVEAEGFRVVRTDEAQRARRLNIGVAATTGAWVLLHHPRSVLEAQAFDQIQTLEYPGWAAFTHCFDQAHPLLTFTSWYSNHVRFRRGIVYLDHCIVVAREWLCAIGGVPEIDIFEDTELSIRLRKLGAPQRLSAVSLTSAIRFVSKGIVQQSLSNQLLKLKYYIGTDQRQLNRRYEGPLELNGPTAEMKEDHDKSRF